MIKARGDRDGSPVFIIGLSRSNTTRLHAGKPLIVKLDDLGGEGELCIIAGETELALAEALAPSMSPATTVRILSKEG